MVNETLFASIGTKDTVLPEDAHSMAELLVVVMATAFQLIHVSQARLHNHSHRSTGEG